MYFFTAGQNGMPMLPMSYYTAAGLPWYPPPAGAAAASGLIPNGTPTTPGTTCISIALLNSTLVIVCKFSMLVLFGLLVLKLIMYRDEIQP